MQPPRVSLDWSNHKFYYTSSQQEYQAETSVKLLDLTRTYSNDEELLICQVAEDEWVAWIPDCGEAVLKTRQFCSDC